MDVSFLKPLYSRPGPYASVYVDMTRTTEDAEKVIELRWRALREELEARHCPAATLRAVEEKVSEELRRRRSEGLVIFAAGGEVAYSARLAHPPRTSLARVSPLPHVLPYLCYRGERFAHLVARVNRRGGEIDCFGQDGRHHHIDVPGDEDYPIRKTKAGDWNQSRFQRSSENVWKINAKKVAREVDKAARDCNAEAVVIAGDPRARTTVLEEISEGTLEKTVESDRGEIVDDDLSRILELKSAERILTVAERFERELANGERAVSGLPATVEAVRRSQVESLLLDDDPDSPASLWIGPDPGDVATKPDELRWLGVNDIQEERADAALVRAVAATDGDLVVLPSDSPDTKFGVGAVLRYNDTTTVHE
jgi:inosine/xanthosine triphosphate pyrophosphatase family protein